MFILSGIHTSSNHKPGHNLGEAQANPLPFGLWRHDTLTVASRLLCITYTRKEQHDILQSQKPERRWLQLTALWLGTLHWQPQRAAPLRGAFITYKTGTTKKMKLPRSCQGAAPKKSSVQRSYPILFQLTGTACSCHIQLSAFNEVKSNCLFWQKGVRIGTSAQRAQQKPSEEEQNVPCPAKSEGGWV